MAAVLDPGFDRCCCYCFEGRVVPIAFLAGVDPMMMERKVVVVLFHLAGLLSWRRR